MLFGVCVRKVVVGRTYLGHSSRVDRQVSHPYFCMISLPVDTSPIIGSLSRLTASEVIRHAGAI